MVKFSSIASFPFLNFIRNHLQVTLGCIKQGKDLDQLLKRLDSSQYFGCLSLAELIFQNKPIYCIKIMLKIFGKLIEKYFLDYKKDS